VCITNRHRLQFKVKVPTLLENPLGDTEMFQLLSNSFFDFILSTLQRKNQIVESQS